MYPCMCAELTINCWFIYKTLNQKSVEISPNLVNEVCAKTYGFTMGSGEYSTKETSASRSTRQYNKQSNRKSNRRSNRQSNKPPNHAFGAFWAPVRESQYPRPSQKVPKRQPKAIQKPPGTPRNLTETHLELVGPGTPNGCPKAA